MRNDRRLSVEDIAMRLFAGMSIRAVLGQIIGALGILLIALSAMELFAAVERNEAARRVASLAGTGQQLLMVKQAASTARNFGGLMALRIETATAAGRPWSSADIIESAEDRGRAALAWSQVMEAAARSDAPAVLVDAVARSKAPAVLA